ncbi:homoserine dehydrogenase, partial [Mesorhizobium sp. M1393]
MAHPQFAAELLQRAEQQGPITIGLAGAGQMGTDIVVQVALMPGMRIGAISEVRPQAAIDAALLAGHDRSDIV